MRKTISALLLGLLASCGMPEYAGASQAPAAAPAVLSATVCLPG